VSATPAEVVGFWRDAGMGKWFGGGEAFDAECRARFIDAHFAAARRECEGWMDTAEGALGLLILLDQIPRNVFRRSGHAFASDGLALHYATRAIDAGFDAATETGLRMFFYLPFEHSEAMPDQDRAVALFTALGNANLLAYANAHRDAIARFGRFPHRNAVLGRSSTPDERAWLDAGGGF
jgi:uncharacterized protein (DUF924 family)